MTDTPQMTIDIRQARISLARRSFWHYLKIKDPDFYNERRPHLKDFANTLQDFADDKIKTKSGTTAKYLLLTCRPGWENPTP